MKKTYLTISLLILSLPMLTACHSENKKLAKEDIQHTFKNMVFIKGATYMMGPKNPELYSNNNTPRHKVTLSPFYFYRFNVSYGEYDKYTESMGLPFIQANLRNPPPPYFSRANNYPVNNITWNQAHAYCHWLKQQTGLPFSLPTEAQWQYVARALGKTDWYFATNNGWADRGKNFPTIAQQSNQKGNIGGTTSPLPVGSVPCTPQGICGLGGEVNQWVNDWYAKDYYAHSPELDPQGPKTGTEKVMTAGGSDGSWNYANNYGRYGVDPTSKNGGFRCVINSSKPIKELEQAALKHLQTLSG